MAAKKTVKASDEEGFHCRRRRLFVKYLPVINIYQSRGSGYADQWWEQFIFFKNNKASSVQKY